MHAERRGRLGWGREREIDVHVSSLSVSISTAKPPKHAQSGTHRRTVTSVTEGICAPRRTKTRLAPRGRRATVALAVEPADGVGEQRDPLAASRGDCVALRFVCLALHAQCGAPRSHTNWPGCAPAHRSCQSLCRQRRCHYHQSLNGSRRVGVSRHAPIVRISSCTLRGCLMTQMSMLSVQ